MKRPVCRLKLALYGHPDSGGHWERHCEQHLRSVGFVPVREWRSVFWREQERSLLVVYVDDFKLGGPSSFLPGVWKPLRGGIWT